ncbi:MAG: type II secretion system protein GspG [Planctomycetaceae bacterium]|nr:type II secretion system protein GspG [Planctomycetaceae bacterium]
MIHFNCTQCGESYNVNDNMAGRTAPCQQCGQIIAVPLSGTFADPVPAPITPAPQYQQSFPQQTVVNVHQAAPQHHQSQALPALVSFFLPGVGQLIQGRVIAWLMWTGLWIIACISCFVLVGFILAPIVAILCVVETATWYPGKKSTLTYILIGIAGFIALIALVAFLSFVAIVEIPDVTTPFLSDKNQLAKTELVKIGSLLDQYKSIMGNFPSTEEGLNALCECPPSVDPTDWVKVANWNTPPLDPWGNNYNYRCPGEDGNIVNVGSNGPDGDPGTADDIWFSM